MPEAMPLRGRTIIELGQLIPAPYAGRILVDLGARVVKVEPPAGDPLRQFNPRLFDYLNTGKECVCLDLKREPDKDVLRSWIPGADGFIDGFRAGVCERLGAGYAQLSSLNPALVYVSMSAFGRKRSRPAHDINCEAMSGVLRCYLDGAAPSVPIAPFANVFAGMMAVQHLLARLASREGVGGYVDLSMQHASAYGHGPLLLERLQLEAGEAVVPLDEMHSAVVFRCADGQWLAIATLEPWIWERLTAVLSVEGIERIGYQTSRAGLSRGREVLARRFAERPRAEWLAALEAADLPATPALSPREAIADMRHHGDGVVPAAPDFDGRAPPLPPAGAVPKELAYDDG